MPLYIERGLSIRPLILLIDFGQLHISYGLFQEKYPNLLCACLTSSKLAISSKFVILADKDILCAKKVAIYAK